MDEWLPWVATLRYGWMATLRYGWMGGYAMDGWLPWVESDRPALPA